MNGMLAQLDSMIGTSFLIWNNMMSMPHHYQELVLLGRMIELMFCKCSMIAHINIITNRMVIYRKYCIRK